MHALVEELVTESLAISESDNTPCKQTLSEYYDYSNFISAEDLKSPDNGQAGISEQMMNAEIYTQKPVKTKKWSAIKHKGEKPSFPPLMAPCLPASTGKSIQFFHYDTLKADDITTEQKAQQDQINAAALSLADIKQMKKQLAGVSIKPHEGQYYATPSTVSTASPTPYSTYIMGKDAVFTTGFSNPYEIQHYQKELAWAKSQIEEYKEIVKQLSGEPGEFIYIHPFDLYELINSFVIPTLLNVNEEMKDNGFIEINGKKYKQSVLIPAKTKNIK